MIDDDNLGLAGSKKATPPEVKTIEKTKTNAVIDWIVNKSRKTGHSHAVMLLQGFYLRQRSALYGPPHY